MHFHISSLDFQFLHNVCTEEKPASLKWRQLTTFSASIALPYTTEGPVVCLSVSVTEERGEWICHRCEFSQRGLEIQDYIDGVCVQERPVSTDHFEANIMQVFQQEVTQDNKKLTERQLFFWNAFPRKTVFPSFSILFICHFVITCDIVVKN